MAGTGSVWPALTWRGLCCNLRLDLVHFRLFRGQEVSLRGAWGRNLEVFGLRVLTEAISWPCSPRAFPGCRDPSAFPAPPCEGPSQLSRTSSHVLQCKALSALGVVFIYLRGRGEQQARDGVFCVLYPARSLKSQIASNEVLLTIVHLPDFQ